MTTSNKIPRKSCRDSVACALLCIRIQPKSTTPRLCRFGKAAKREPALPVCLQTHILFLSNQTENHGIPMKQYLLATGVVLALAGVSASAVVFTNNTLIGPLNTNYDGADIVISNCVITVDGPHSFASLRVAGTGLLTHTYDPSGSISITGSVTNEPVVLAGTSASSLANSNIDGASVIVTDVSGTTVFTNSADYILIYLADGPRAIQRTDTSTIPDGATVLVSYKYVVMVHIGVNLAISGDVQIEPGASMDVSGRGASFGGVGIGGATGSGGGYGGYGGLGASNLAGGNCQGSPTAPSDAGSGGGSGIGGPGGIGGGATRLVVGGNFLLDGMILANGTDATNSRAGGGSGGGIWVTTQAFSGAGAIHANGGAGEPSLGGGGGGGRVAIEFATNTFSGIVSAFGGPGWQRGGAGTIFLRQSGTAGVLTFDNGAFPGAMTLLAVTNAPDLVLKGSAMSFQIGLQTVGNLIVRSNSSMSGSDEQGLHLTARGNGTIDAGAVLSMDGRGHSGTGSTGDGRINSTGTAGGGGGHGGFGGAGVPLSGPPAAGGVVYDSILSPNSVGAGGAGLSPSAGGPSAGGIGGGLVRLTVTGNLQLNGRISVDATAGAGNASGGGAGGSLVLTLGGLSGAGVLSANGGSGGLPYGGGGGGGRMAVTWTSNSFTGSMMAHGGAGAMAGGAGTIYTKGPTVFSARLLADNDGLQGTNTDFNLTGINDAVLASGAMATSTVTSVTLSNLTVGSNSALFVGQTFTVNATNLTVSSGGFISADGTSSSQVGLGAYSPSGSGGGGHAGFGGRGAAAAGGNAAFDSSTSPTSPGGRGGSSPAVGTAPNGGGALRLNAINLRVDGRISANGLAATTNNNGGGAGGAIWITANTLAGTGGFFVEGGPGHLPLGGGGAGGRIAVYYSSDLFTGVMSVKGAAGYGNGSAGTIYLQSNNGFTRLTLDNGGLAGTNTMIDVRSVGDLNIQGGAAASNTFSPFNCNTFTLGSNSSLRFGRVEGSFTLTISSNAAVDGLLTLDGLGNGSIGTGQLDGGGGHGGYGGSGPRSVGGTAFDSTTTPTAPGGNGGLGFSAFTRGGGALRMTVNGAMTLNGKISANGASGVATNIIGGGGAGGSVYLTVGGLSGGGAISADGGPGGMSGNVPLAGGGGGGRIAVYYTSNTFSGTFSARGGIGYMNGGAGTIYLKRQDRNSGDLVIDNGGSRGTNSMFDSSLTSFANLSVLGGASVTSTAQGLTISNLTIGPSSVLQLGSVATLNISGTASIANLGMLSADGTGSGPGAGATTNFSASSGGGHGGYGGSGNGIAGGGASDVVQAPTLAGGRGGNNGGFGGGALRVAVTRLLQVDGTISANGVSSTNAFSSGGGAGGSIWLSAGGLAGGGAITANGAAGRFSADGGGAGGRIAVSCASNSFSGQYSARGGAGFVYGGAGTVYVNSSTNQAGQVMIDNGGPRGANTLVQGANLIDLTVQGGGVVSKIATVLIRDLLVRSNGWVTQPGVLMINRDATIEAGGAFNIDGLSTDSLGFGLDSRTQAGGGGHGGYGGQHANGGGTVYDQVNSPAFGGGRGGNGSGTNVPPLGGLGGGVLHLTVNGTTRVDGMISAAGLNGDGYSGGGAGGSLWLSLNTLTGTGSISARGGNGNNLGGGGGGGRIAIFYNTNFFNGSAWACGGSGYENGGAGSVYLKDNNRAGDLLTLDNCGLAGAHTPLALAYLARNLVVTNGAIGQLQGQLPPLSNITVSAGGQLTGSAYDSNVNLSVLGNLLIATGGVFQVDELGFAQAGGLGAGNSNGGKGSGAGYGGVGGDSASGAPGGSPYGSGIQPVDRGSGGGLGAGSGSGGSEGGGALRLSVKGQARVDGVLSANGGAGLQDDSGGGSGGSIWIMAKALTGHGTISVKGGDGELYGGGGGAGGRIAINSPAYSFAGDIAMEGGLGAFNGNSGSLYISSVLPGLEVIAQNPSGLVSNSVNQITIEFDSLVDQSSVTVDDLKLYGPRGIIAPSTMALSFLDGSTLRIAVPYQSEPGAYLLDVGPDIRDFLGQPMSRMYSGTFTIAIPAITGHITDTNGSPVAGVLLRQDNGPLTATSDANGAYILGVDPGWSGNVVPALDPLIFVPGARSYTNIMAAVANQDYLVVTSLAASLSSGLRGTNFALDWFGVQGVTYQSQYSTNLVDWVTYAGSLVGTNGPAEVLVPIDGDPQKFFRIRASN
jgi:hypothetical protein